MLEDLAKAQQQVTTQSFFKGKSVSIIKQKWRKSMVTLDRRIKVPETESDLEELESNLLIFHPTNHAVYNRALRIPFTLAGLREFFRDRLEDCPTTSCDAIYSMFPATKWLQSYKWTDDLTHDIIAGFTVAVMHIPQGMAYSQLAYLNPIVGIYMAIIPVLAYFFMGTSRHVSLGTMAVVCLMTGQIVIQHTGTPNEENGQEHYTPAQIAGTVCFICGVSQVIAGALHIGKLSIVLSDVLVSGFTTGAAVHVFTAQMKNLSGIEINRFSGLFKIFKTYIDMFGKVKQTNLAAIIISFISISIIVFNNQIMKPYVKKVTNFPIPIELVVVATGTIVSHFGNLPGNFNIAVVGNIPAGFPDPILPRFELMLQILSSSVIIAIVSYTIMISMGKILAQKSNEYYEVGPTQELISLGFSNLFGSFFGCIPVTSSLSRSLIQQNVGGKTQLASIFSIILLLLVVLWIGPSFKALPLCVLSSIIVVALRSMLMQVTDLKEAWKKSRYDAFIWIVTFASAVILDIEYGLIFGVTAALCTILCRSQSPCVTVVGVVPDTDFYLDVECYSCAKEISGYKVIRYTGSLHFINTEKFKRSVYRLTGVMPKQILALPSEAHSDMDFVCLILDFAALTFVDPAGVSGIKAIEDEFNAIGVHVVLTGCSASVLQMMEKCDLMPNLDKLQLFPDLHSAMVYYNAV